MLGSDYKIFFKMFTVLHQPIIESYILAMSWPRDLTEYTLLDDQSTFVVFHDVHDVTGKRSCIKHPKAIKDTLMENYFSKN